MAASATDSIGLLTMMAVGGIAAILGFWLMLLQGPGGEAMRIGIGNAKISASAAGSAVFFTGLTCFSTPIVAPDGTQGLMVAIAPAAFRLGDGSGLATDDFRAASGSMGPDAEPRNNRLTGATTVMAGQLAGGTHSGNDVDWFRLDTKSVRSSGIEVEISERARGCHARLYDNRQQYLGTTALDRGQNQIRLDVSGRPEVYVELACIQSAGTSGYTITFGPIAN